MAIVHNRWMKTPEDYQATLLDALNEVSEGPDSPPFMRSDLEAMALLKQMRRVEELLREGSCPLPALMALAQQAIRAAAVGCVQCDAKEDSTTALSTDRNALN